MSRRLGQSSAEVRLWHARDPSGFGRRPGRLGHRSGSESRRSVRSQSPRWHSGSRRSLGEPSTQCDSTPTRWRARTRRASSSPVRRAEQPTRTHSMNGRSGSCWTTGPRRTAGSNGCRVGSVRTASHLEDERSLRGDCGRELGRSGPLPTPDDLNDETTEQDGVCCGSDDPDRSAESIADVTVSDQAARRLVTGGVHGEF